MLHLGYTGPLLTHSCLEEQIHNAMLCAWNKHFSCDHTRSTSGPTQYISLSDNQILVIYLPPTCQTNWWFKKLMTSLEPGFTSYLPDRPVLQRVTISPNNQGLTLTFEPLVRRASVRLKLVARKRFYLSNLFNINKNVKNLVALQPDLVVPDSP
jgi:hypothetical protein